MNIVGMTPVMIVLLLYCFYLAYMYSQPSIANDELIPYRVHLQTDPPHILELLPGIGPIMARKIVEFRESQPIESPDDLRDIHGIGKMKVESLRLLTVSGAQQK